MKRIWIKYETPQQVGQSNSPSYARLRIPQHTGENYSVFITRPRLDLNNNRGVTKIKTSTYFLLLQIWWVRTTRATDWRPFTRDPSTPLHAALLGCQWFDILIISFPLGSEWLLKTFAPFTQFLCADWEPRLRWRDSLPRLLPPRFEALWQIYCQHCNSSSEAWSSL